MKIYLAGPMTGIPQFNFPAFDAAAADLRERGYTVVSPAELDRPETRAAALASPDGAMGSGTHDGETWGDFLARDVKLIADDGVEAIVCLDGWQRSKGARLETFVGRLAGLPIYEYRAGRWLHGVYDQDVDEAHAWRDGEGAGDYYNDFDDADIEHKPTLTDVEDDPFYEALAERTRELGSIRVTIDGKPFGQFHQGGEIRVTNATTGGEKGSKPQAMSLLPWDVLMQDVSPLYAKGAQKYERDNWRKGYDWSLSFDALGRHLAQFHGGQWLDEETGCPHLASVVFHACALMYFQRSHPELNDINALEVQDAAR